MGALDPLLRSQEVTEGMIAWMEEACRVHELQGRCRVGREGVNCNLSGTSEGCHSFVQACKEHASGCFLDTDFKCAPTSKDALFSKLLVWQVREICALGVDEALQIQLGETQGGQHISPAAFHQALQEDDENTVVIDVRNAYETRIGRFEGVCAKTLDPNTRHFSDLPRWFDENAPNLRDKKVLMYCTGGVRCEKASSLLATYGVEDISQLSGGIERYLEEFPEDGGCFKGRNYVFDKSQVAGPEQAPLDSARCVLCNTHWEHYQGRHPRRCAVCKMPVLVCQDCVYAGKDTKVELLCNVPGCCARGGDDHSALDS